MPRTFVRQDIQILNSDVYDDTLAAGILLETGAANGEDDFNGLRSQTNRIIDPTGAGNWYDDIPTVNGKQRGLLQLNTNLNTVETQRFLFHTAVATDVAVPAAQNWVVLSVAGSEAPTQVASVGNVATEGAVVAQAAPFDAHSLAAVASSNPFKPKNICTIVDAATQDPILSGDRQIYGLLQSESAVDGAAFDDAANQVQISFVRINPVTDALEAVPVADIENRTIEYQYVRRVEFLNIPEDAYLNGVFVDQIAAVDVTRQNAYDNQGTTPVELANNADLDIGVGFFWRIRDALDAPLLQIDEGSTGGTTTATWGAATDVYQNNAQDVDFNQGVTVAEASTPINLGLNPGVIETTGADDLTARAAGELFFDDVNQTGSTWAQDGIKLSEDTAEWDDFETVFGEVSILNAIVQAGNAAGRQKASAVVTTAVVAPNTNVTGVGGGANLDAALIDYSSVNFVDDVDVYVNGILQRNGVDAAANHDVYPGVDPTNGDLRFEFRLRGGVLRQDQITMIVYGV